MECTSLVATNLILLVLMMMGWAGFFTLAYALMKQRPTYETLNQDKRRIYP